MAKFNAVAFLRANAETCRTSISGPDKIRVSLQGLPKAYTVAGLASLAEENGLTRVSLPRAELKNGRVVNSSAQLKGEKGAEFVRGICGTEADEPPQG